LLKRLYIRLRRLLGRLFRRGGEEVCRGEQCAQKSIGSNLRHTPPSQIPEAKRMARELYCRYMNEYGFRPAVYVEC